MLKSTAVFPTISMSKHFRRIRNTYLIHADEHYSIFLLNKNTYLPVPILKKSLYPPIW